MSKRDEVAAILEQVAVDDLSQPRDLDVALDAIFCTLGLDEEGERPSVKRNPPPLWVHLAILAAAATGAVLLASLLPWVLQWL